MQAEIINNCDVRYLDEMLRDGDQVQPVWAHRLSGVNPVHLRYWCHKNAVYQIPTWELIHWLQREIDGRTAIEVCAGKSCLGRHLGIRMTDSYMQADPAIQLLYEMLQQPAIRPPKDVERIDANAAILKYRPQVVIGAWVSQKRLTEDEREQANLYGPDEYAIIDACTYIHIGNLGPQGQKRIFVRPHRELRFAWLVSRAIQPSLNRIWVWDR